MASFEHHLAEAERYLAEPDGRPERVQASIAHGLVALAMAVSEGRSELALADDHDPLEMARRHAESGSAA